MLLFALNSSLWSLQLFSTIDATDGTDSRHITAPNTFGSNYGYDNEPSYNNIQPLIAELNAQPKIVTARTRDNAHSLSSSLFDILDMARLITALLTSPFMPFDIPSANLDRSAAENDFDIPKDMENTVDSNNEATSDVF